MQHFWYNPAMEQLPISANVAIVLITLWTIPWKIYAVWLSVKNDHKKWFVVLLLLNTIAILEIIYIFKIAKKSWPEVKGAFKGVFKKKE